jgi:outer membrane receptor protein involved in Fe transport
VRPTGHLIWLIAAPAALGQVAQLDPVTVSSTRAPVPESQVPFTVEVLAQDALGEGPSMTVDGALGDSADFSLFRRNDSMTANPTSQGVSLRGLGPSGTSRSLVLLDGIPLNDPFGGWVPWSLVPAGSLERAEIVPGGGASAWGDAALAGVIQLFSRQPAAGSGLAAAQAGGLGTRSAYASQAVRLGPGTLELSGQDFATDGAVLVAAAERGPLDIDAASRHELAQARWRGEIGPVAATFTLRSYGEWRDNGTPYQQNRLQSLLASAALSGGSGGAGSWSVTAYAQDQGASQTFSSVNAARTSETPASDQFAVPATALGLAGSSTWTDASGGATTVGADARDVRGETREDYSYSGGTYTQRRFAGGRQAFAGAFAERAQALGPGLRATAAARLDRWENSDGHLRTSEISTGAPTADDAYPDRAGTEFSPSAGITWQALPELEFHLAGQRAFRVPTLNELYRPFRQGATVTLSNPALSAEHADSAEVGATWRSGGLRVALVGFAARLEDPVSNVTLVSGPGTFPGFGTLPAGGVGQQRLNLGRVDTRGVQLGADWQPSGAFAAFASVVGESAVVASAPVAPALVGNRVPEVPRWNASVGATWHPQNRLYVTARVRRSGQEYDDDLNLLPLAPATVVDASVRVEVCGHAEVFISAENLGDATIETAHSAAGVFSVAPPRLASAGVQARW